MKSCPNCHNSVEDNSQFCPRCGYNFNTQANQQQTQFRQYVNPDDPFAPCGPEGKCRGIAALLAILLGGLGIQYFYVGKTTAGLLTILITLCTCSVWQILMVVQGILMFTMNNEQFRQKYVTSTSTFPIF